MCLLQKTKGFVVLQLKDNSLPHFRDATASSALCVYSLHKIQEMMRSNKYWNRNTDSGSFYTVFPPSWGPAPGTCVANTNSLSHKRFVSCS